VNKLVRDLVYASGFDNSKLKRSTSACHHSNVTKLVLAACLTCQGVCLLLLSDSALIAVLQQLQHAAQLLYAIKQRYSTSGMWYVISYTVYCMK
jgi:hypothetical protein